MTIYGGQLIRHKIEGVQFIGERISDADLVDRRPKDGQIFYGSDAEELPERIASIELTALVNSV